MMVLLRRLSNDRHRLEVRRGSGPVIDRELETRSVLLHDLVHFAVEAEAGLDEGFWGALASGADFDDLLADDAEARFPGLSLAESLVGPMQSVWSGRLTPAAYVDHLGERVPFVDAGFVDRVLERIRRLWGHWQGTPFHGAMELEWPPSANPTH